MLQVGETSALRPLIEDQLGQIPLFDGPGHDGQIFYAIGLDLTGDEVGPLLDHAAYRYRRILYPLLASLGGLLDGTALMYSMLVVNVIGFGAATAIVASMANRSGRSHFWGLAVLLNPGVWLSLQLMTSDVIALALMLVALSSVVWIGTSASWFALSGLSKDVFLATPIPIGIERPRTHWLLAGVPAAMLLAWMTYLQLTLGDGFASRGNLTWPFGGMIEASTNWAFLDIREKSSPGVRSDFGDCRDPGLVSKDMVEMAGRGLDCSRAGLVQLGLGLRKQRGPSLRADCGVGGFESDSA